MALPVQVFDRLLEISVLLHADMARAFTGTGLTTSRTHLLWELHRLGPSTQQALACALNVTPRNVTGLVDALESHGYVERRAHPTDRRALQVTLTERGSRTTAVMESDREQVAAALIAGLSDDELDQFDRTLTSVADRLRDMVTDAAADAAVTGEDT
jgi:DNA-binding MarR family transcriptional regulator